MRSPQRTSPDTARHWVTDILRRHNTCAANAALAGAMLPTGDAKGAALILMVEVLAGALTGANLSHQASSFLHAEGQPPGVGQTVIAIDPTVFCQRFTERLEQLIGAIEAQPGARLPGTCRLARRAAAQRTGLAIEPGLLKQLHELRSA